MEERRISLRIIKTELPETVRGAVSDRGNGSYIILINQTLDEKAQAEAFIHEALHIYHNDFESELSLDKLESIRHEESESILKAM